MSDTSDCGNQMTVFQTMRGRTTWVLWVTALSIVLGGLLAASFKTNRTLRELGIHRRGVGFASVLQEQAGRIKESQAEITRLQQKNAEWEDRFATGANESEALGKELREVKILAGLVPVEGEGVIVTLQDSKQTIKEIGSGLSAQAVAELKSAGLVHDSDIRLVIDELFAAGAEAVAVKDQRVVTRTAVRCVGPSTMVNDVKMASPFIIRAIGNSKEIMGALKMPGGLLDGDFTTLKMIKIEESKHMILPAYAGSASIKYAKPVQ